MSDFKLYGGAPPASDPAGVMTQGIGFPLREVDLTASPGLISASDVTFSDPQYPALDNVAKVLAFLLLVSRETSAMFTRVQLPTNGYLNLGGVSSEETGWINSGTAYISKITVGRTDIDAATLEVLVNGNPVVSLSTGTEKASFGPFLIPLNDLDAISVRNKAGSPPMTSVVCVITIKQVQE